MFDPFAWFFTFSLDVHAFGRHTKLHETTSGHHNRRSMSTRVWFHMLRRVLFVARIIVANPWAGTLLQYYGWFPCLNMFHCKRSFSVCWLQRRWSVALYFRSWCLGTFPYVFLLISSSSHRLVPADEVLSYVVVGEGSTVLSALPYPYYITTYLKRGPAPLWRTVLLTTYMLSVSL